MRILITGAEGFIGKNLISLWKAKSSAEDPLEMIAFDRSNTEEELERFCSEADFVMHLAGVNKAEYPDGYRKGNYDLTANLLNLLRKTQNNCPVMYASSTQALLGNPYGESKRAAEDLVFAYGEETGARVLVYRFPSVFGKWSKPNHNSVIATLCYNLSRELPISIEDREATQNLVFIDDLADELTRAIKGQENRIRHKMESKEYCWVPISYSVPLGQVVDQLVTFRNERNDLFVSDLRDPFTKKLYSTWLSYLPEENLRFLLKAERNPWGTATDLLKSHTSGLISVSVTKPGCLKGNHWHQSKVEKYVVLSGRGVIRLRMLGSNRITEYFVSGEAPELIDIPAGYTHNLENLGETDLVTIHWTDECFLPGQEDTYFLPV